MARESRKKKKAGVLAPTVTSALLICLAAALALLVQIRLKADLHRLYNEINTLDRQVAQARRVNQKLQVDYEMLTSPAGLHSRLRDLRLNLIMPGEDARVVRQDLAYRLASIALEDERAEDARSYADRGLALGAATDVFTANLYVVRGQARETLGDAVGAAGDYHEALIVNEALLDRVLDPSPEEER